MIRELLTRLDEYVERVKPSDDDRDLIGEIRMVLVKRLAAGRPRVYNWTTEQERNRHYNLTGNARRKQRKESEVWICDEIPSK